MEQRCVVWGTRIKGQHVAEMATDLGWHVVAYCSSKGLETKIGGCGVVTPEEAKALWNERKIDAILLGMANSTHQEEVKNLIACEFPPDIRVISLDEIENRYLQKAIEHLQYQWNVPFAEQSAIWFQNFMSEVDFWASEVASPKGGSHHTYRQRMDNTDFLGLDNTWQYLAQELHSQSIVMDIGCGLVPYYGDRLPSGERIQLIGVDPLAPFYNHINQKCAGGSYRAYQFGLFEFIANFYAENYSDAIIISNALDHCIDPYKSIIECLHILKPGGKLCLLHRRSEACFGAYEGLHKWNIDYNSKNELIIWNQQNAVNVTEKLQKIADVQVTPAADKAPRLQQMFHCELTKKRDFRLDEFLDLSAERRELAVMIDHLMTWIAEHEADYLKDLPEHPADAVS